MPSIFDNLSDQATEPQTAKETKNTANSIATLLSLNNDNSCPFVQMNKLQNTTTKLQFISVLMLIIIAGMTLYSKIK